MLDWTHGPPSYAAASLLHAATGPADLQEAFKWCYGLAGRTPSKPASGGSSSSNPLSGLFGGLGGLLGGGGSSSGVGSSKRGPDSFPEADVKVLEGLNNTLLKLKVVYDDAEQRE